MGRGGAQVNIVTGFRQQRFCPTDAQSRTDVEPQVGRRAAEHAAVDKRRMPDPSRNEARDGFAIEQQAGTDQPCVSADNT